MKRWLITGGCGFMGSHLVRRLLQREAEISLCNLDALTYAGRLENVADCAGDPRYQFIQADVADAVAVEVAFASFRPDVVVHLAAETHVDRSITAAEVFARTNVVGTQVLLDAARRHGVRRFVQVSTDEVYGSLGPSGRFTEESPLAPNSPYAASKAGADLLVRAAVQTHGLPAIIVRPSNNYGPQQFPEKLIPLAVRHALAGRPIPLYGDGTQVRDWLYVEDACAGILAAAESGEAGGVYNLGGGQERSNRALLERLLDLLQRPRALITPVANRPGHDFRYAMDSSRARRELGWEPQVALEDGLRRTVEWYAAHPDWPAACP
ncbi:MAG TPA: dTDP-glucose 4,6-dehydratase [Terriglobales bacterium]